MVERSRAEQGGVKTAGPAAVETRQGGAGLRLGGRAREVTAAARALRGSSFRRRGSGEVQAACAGRRGDGTEADGGQGCGGDRRGRVRSQRGHGEAGVARQGVLDSMARANKRVRVVAKVLVRAVPRCCAACA